MKGAFRPRPIKSPVLQGGDLTGFTFLHLCIFGFCFLVFYIKRVIIKVYGRVQGVFFRSQTKVQAEKLGLTGWARNEEDGTVLIVAEGEEDKLRKLIEWCESGGPILAKVDKVEVKWEEGIGEFNNFEIKY